MDACLCQNLADAPQKMKILHSFCNIENVKFNTNFTWKKKNYLQTDLTKNMIDVNPKKRLKVV